MVERLIRIDGDNISFIFDDKIPRIGEMECQRASDVIFDKALQKWRIKWADGTLSYETFDLREEAINSEIETAEFLLMWGVQR